MRSLWFRLLRSPWKVSLIALAVAVSTASATAFDALPNLSSKYPSVARALWILVIMLSVLLFLADRLTGSIEWKARVFRFEKKVWVVTGALQDPQGNYGIPYYDLKAGELITGILNTMGIESQIDHCKSSSLSRNLGDNLILICGPVANDYSCKVNGQLSRDVAWFNGFYFGESVLSNSHKSSGQQWSILHRGMTKLDIPFSDLPNQGIAEDCGIIFIGPNPINTDNWIIWAAGLGPMATYGAVKAFLNPILLELLGRGLFSRHRYCSALIQYRFNPANPIDGSVSNIIVTGGPVN